MNPATVQRLLDPAAAAAMLAPWLASTPSARLSLDAVWAKPSRHCNVCYRVDDAGSAPGPRLLSLCVVGADEGAKATRRAAKDGSSNDASGGTGPEAAMVADDVLAQAFPFDYRLPHLGDCHDPAIVHGLLGDRSVDGCEVAAYRPGMRCQLRFTARGRVRAYGKLAVERDPGRRRRVHSELGAATALTAMRVPTLLGSVDPVGLDVVAAVDGTSLFDALAAARGEEGVVAAAAALAELHACVPPLPDRTHAATDELELARSWISWMSTVQPEFALRLEALAALLEAALPGSSKVTFVHRDFYDKQILVDGDRLWLLDVDTACAGDPELDLGNFLAQLFLRGLQWDRVPAHRRLEERAATAYGRRARTDATRWYRRASLTRLACVYLLRPSWRRIVPALLDEAAVP